MPKILRENGLSIVLFLLLVLFLAGQALTGWRFFSSFSSPSRYTQSEARTNTTRTSENTEDGRKYPRSSTWELHAFGLSRFRIGRVSLWPSARWLSYRSTCDTEVLQNRSQWIVLTVKQASKLRSRSALSPIHDRPLLFEIEVCACREDVQYEI